MAKENLRGASKAGKIAITRWVSKDTVEALKRLRGQSTHPNPTEGEVVDQAIALFQLHQEQACSAVTPDGKRKCQKWKQDHDAFHANYEIGFTWPVVSVSVGENVGDGAFRGKKMSAEEQRTALKQPLVIDDLGDGPNGGTDFNSDMEWSKDKYLRDPPVGISTPPPSPLEDSLNVNRLKLTQWQEGADFKVAASSAHLCVHCNNPMPAGSLPTSSICKTCFLSGHRNMPGCPACAENNQ